MEKPKRPVLAQRFIAYALAVPAVPAAPPTPLGAFSLQTLYTTVAISNPAGGVPVLFGGANVDPVAGNGLWIQPGTTLPLTIPYQRQYYEVQAPLVDEFCTTPEAIPYVTWDLSQMFLGSLGGASVIGVALFPDMYI